MEGEEEGVSVCSIAQWQSAYTLDQSQDQYQKRKMTTGICKGDFHLYS